MEQALLMAGELLAEAKLAIGEVDQNQPSEMLISHPEMGPPITNASGAPNWKKAFILARIFVGNQKVM